MIFIPLGQGPDEPNHVIHTLLYVQQKDQKLAFQHNSAPVRSHLTDPVDDPHFWNYTIHDNAIVEKVFVILNRYNFWNLVDVSPPFPTTLNDVHELGLDEYITIRRYITPLYFYLMSLPLRWLNIEDVINQWYFLRFISMIMGLGVVGFSYLTAKIVFKKLENDIAPLAVAAFIAFLPQFSFLSSIVNPDNLLFLLAAAILYIICISTQAEKRLRYFILIMVLSALCCVVKEQGIPVAISAFLAMFFIVWSSKNTNPSEKIYTIFQPVYVFMVFILLVGTIIYLIGDKASLGRFFDVTQTRSCNFETFSKPADYVRCFFIWFASFWFSYGWMVYKMSISWYFVFGIITIFGMIGIIKAIFSNKGKGSINKQYIFLMIIFVLISLISVLIFYGPGHKGMQARHFFAVLPAITILQIAGIYNIAPQKYRKTSINIFSVFMIYVNIVTVIKYIIPIYYL